MKALELLGKMLGLFEGGLPRIEENNLLEAIRFAAIALKPFLPDTSDRL